MSVIRWSLLAVVGAAWAVYLAYLGMATATGVEVARSPLRSALVAALVAVTAAALVAVVVRRALRRVEQLVGQQPQAVELGRQLERLRTQQARPGAEVVRLARRWSAPGPHGLPTQYDR